MSVFITWRWERQTWERDREKQRWTDRQTDRQTDRMAEGIRHQNMSIFLELTQASSFHTTLLETFFVQADFPKRTKFPQICSNPGFSRWRLKNVVLETQTNAPVQAYCKDGRGSKWLSNVCVRVCSAELSGNISRRVDCDTSQDQLVLGSCIVRIIIGYDLIVLIFNGHAANTHEVGGMVLWCADSAENE